MRRFQAFALIVLCVLLASLAAPAQKRKYGGAAKTANIVVEPIDTDALKNLITQERQRPLLVNFWATFCDPCRDEFPDLVKIDKEYRPKGLDFIAITLDDLADINTAVPKFLREMNARMPVYLLNVADPEPTINSIDSRWGGALPATFLYDNNGQVVYKHFGRVNTPELRAAIEKLVSSKQ